MKKLLAILVAMTLLVTLAACGEKDTATKSGKTTVAATTMAAGSTAATEAESTTSTTVADTTATKGDASTTGTQAPATTAPTTTTPSEDEGTAIRVLAIGDGMAVDAMEKHLYDMLKGAYDTVQLGILYADKSTVDTHYAAIKGDTKTYELRQNNSGKWTKESKIAPSKALKAADWDYVVIQQSAADSGKPETFGKLKDLTALIAKQCGDAAIYWHMGWAYQQSYATLMADYGYNQHVMYQSIIKTTLQQVMTDDNVWALIPTATAIQNLRTSSLKDTLTTDGIRLTDTYGDYTAALMWYCSLTGEAPDTVTYRPASVKDHMDEIIEAVTNAIDLPSDITAAAGGDGEFKSIKILAVGNSFSVDAMNRHLYQMFEAAGYDEIHLGILYVGGCSVDQHYNYIKNNSGSYQYQENKNGSWTYTENYKAADAFALTDWDIVTVQQVSGSSGMPDTYGNLDALVDLIRPQIGKAKLYWQMTWAYQQDSDHYDFAHYNNDQMTMYNAIVSTVKAKIDGHTAFDGIIPSGTAVQNLRTSTLGDTLTADGYHLENTIGDYTAALTWFTTLTGNDPFSMFYYPAGTVEHFYEIADAVEKAVANPDKVTAVTKP